MYRFLPTIAAFEHTLPEFLRLRLISKGCDEIIKMVFFQSPHLDDTLYPRRTFIPIGKCWSCSAKGDDVCQRVFIMDDYPRRAMVLCDRWQCRMTALFSKLEDMYTENQFVYFYPNIEDKLYKIPRTDPKKKSWGYIVRNYNNIAVFRNEQYYVYAGWKDGDYSYRKLVPLSIFTNMNDITQTFTVRPIYKKLKDFNVSYTI